MGHSGEYKPENRGDPSALGRDQTSTIEVKIQLWRNPVSQNWNVEINNKHYSFINFEVVKRLVAQALSDSKKSLIERRLT